MSVIVPIYNVEQHVDACLRSIAAQSLSDFEAILVDDGSTDDSAEIAERFASGDARFRMVRQENRGLSAARNTGLEECRGAFVAFVDSDDRIAPDYLLRLHGILESSGEDWAACGIRFCSESGGIAVHSAIHGQADPKALPSIARCALDDWRDVVRHFPSAWNKLYRRGLIEGLRFDEGQLFEDHSFFLRVAARSDCIMHTPEALYKQTRGRQGQITGADDDGVFEQFEVLRRMQEIMKGGSKPKAQEAFEMISARLLFERSVSLKDPVRRARFACDARVWLESEGLEASAPWDSDVAAGWALELSGTLPLSVVIDGRGAGPGEINASLRSLMRQHSPGMDVAVLVSPSDEATPGLAELQAICPMVRELFAHRQGLTRALAGLRGRYALIMRAGAVWRDGALSRLLELALEDAADLALCAYLAGAERSYHSGFHDGAERRPRFMRTGEVTLDEDALAALSGEGSNMFISTALAQRALGAGLPQAHEQMSLCLRAALLAERAVYMTEAGLTVFASERDTLPKPAATVAAVRAVLRSVPDGQKRTYGARLLARLIRKDLDALARAGLKPRPWELAVYAAYGFRLGFRASSKFIEARFDPEIGRRARLLADPLGTML